ncbi:MAG: hypothetical protein OXE46_11710 [Chloroflexi bacterium]|nr:hypothetical protein [Chloroflexota bacterium]
MTQVLVVCKTRMKQGLCLGGFTLPGKQKIRLLTADGQNQPTNTPFQVGEIWECLLDPVRDAQKPHTEDMRVLRQRRLRQMSDVKTCLLAELKQAPRRLGEAFNGTLRLTERGSAYVSESGDLPDFAHDFWQPTMGLRLQRDGKRAYYVFEKAAPRPFRLRYVGVDNCPKRIPPGSLLHLSLARPWQPKPTVEKRCYLQLSAVYV